MFICKYSFYKILQNKKKMLRASFDLPSDISRSRISHAKMVGFSRLYCSILETTAGVATFGFDPPISPGGRNVPAKTKTKKNNNNHCLFSIRIRNI